MRALFISFGTLILAACAGVPTPVPPPVYYPSPVYGPPGDVANPTQGPFQPNAELYLCPGNVSNAPAFDGNDRVIDFAPIIVVSEQVVMSSVPVNDACLSSGYGPRGGRTHKGSDYAPRPRNGQRLIYTAAPGVIREARTANGFGNYVVIDHGYGIYTRYAHLAWFEPWVEVGAEIGFGHAIGLMGSSGNATAVHLHFEVLMGDINTQRGSFGLQAYDPLGFPAWLGLDSVS